MDRIIEKNLCKACEHSCILFDDEGNFLVNVCKLNSKSVNPTGGLTTCTWWVAK